MRTWEGVPPKTLLPLDSEAPARSIDWHWDHDTGTGTGTGRVTMPVNWCFVLCGKGMGVAVASEE
jgi:hypothetical protein